MLHNLELYLANTTQLKKKKLSYFASNEYADTFLLVCGSERKPYLEWSTGIEHFVSMLPMMMASLRVHVPDSHRGINIPV